MAQALGAKVAVTVGTEEKVQFCRDMGANAVINYRSEDFVRAVHEVTDGGVDVIVDIIGAKYLTRNLRALAPDGRLVIIGLQGGVKAEVNLMDLLGERKTILGVTLRGRSADHKAAIVEQVTKDVWPLVSAGHIRPIVDTVYPLEEAAKAHERLEAGTVCGKLLLAVGQRS